MHLWKFKKDPVYSTESTSTNLFVSFGIASLYALAGSLFLVGKRPKGGVEKELDIQIRYTTEMNDDDTFLAHNLVKIIRMVLTPLESKISQEEAQLILCMK